MSQLRESKKVKIENQDEEQLSPASSDELPPVQYTIYLSPEGQARLVEMIEDENPKPLPEKMRRAKEQSDRLFGEPH